MTKVTIGTEDKKVLEVVSQKSIRTQSASMKSKNFNILVELGNGDMLEIISRENETMAGYSVKFTGTRGELAKTILNTNF